MKEAVNKLTSLLHSFRTFLLLSLRCWKDKQSINQSQIESEWLIGLFLFSFSLNLWVMRRSASAAQPLHSSKQKFTFISACLPFACWWERRRNKVWFDLLKREIKVSGSESEWRQLGVKPITNHRAIQINFNLFDGAGSCASFTSLHFQLTQRKITFLFMNGSEVKFALLRWIEWKDIITVIVILAPATAVIP